MVVRSDPMLIALMDSVMMVGAAICLLATAVLLTSRQFRIAAKTIFVTVGVIAVYAVVHMAVSLLHV